MPQGLVTYRIESGECEILCLDPLPEQEQYSLVESVRRAALDSSCWRLWLVVSNDNTPALRYYQKAGFRLTAVRRDALLHARALKPSLPTTGIDGLPVYDEVELEIVLRELPPPLQPPLIPTAALAPHRL